MVEVVKNNYVILNYDSDINVNPDTHNPFYLLTPTIKNQAKISDLEAQIATLKKQIDTSLEDSVLVSDQIKVLQDTKRVKKKHSLVKTKNQQYREEGIQRTITSLEKRIAELMYDNDEKFGDKVVRDTVQANLEDETRENEKILEEEKNQYTGIIKEFSTDHVDQVTRIAKIDEEYQQEKFYKSTVSNSYLADSPTQYSSGEQDLVQKMVTETINLNGLSVRYLPRSSDYIDNVWNESPESYFHKGFMVDMMLVGTAGFEGEGHVMTQYGLEFKEEIELNVSIDKFNILNNTFVTSLAGEEVLKFDRPEPIEGDLIIIPFGRSANNINNYVPKVFQINYVTTYTDGNFFQIGELYQHKIKASLFEISAEDINFAPVISRQGITLSDSDIGIINDVQKSIIDSDISRVDTIVTDPFGDNYDIEKRSQERVLNKNNGEEAGRSNVLVDDYTSRAFGIKEDIISELDDI